MDNFDVTLIATRRPEVLDLTLRSFYNNLLSNFRSIRLFVNIDPIWGDEKDDANVELICKKYFTEVHIRRPDTASFGAAVQWVWGRTTSRWFLHLEDDWLLARKISPEHLERELADVTVGQVHLKNGSRSRRLLRPVRNRLKQGRPGAEKFPLPLTTSPGFIHADFASVALQYLDPNLDPERQFSLGYNPSGAAALKCFHPKKYGNVFTPSLLYDTGRAWRLARGKTKRLVAGKSIWEDSPVSSGPFVEQMARFEKILKRSQSLPAV